MSGMKKTSISIRQLQQNLKRVLARVERGLLIDVTRRRRPAARLAPLRSIGRRRRGQTSMLGHVPSSAHAS
jgi:prevent-host-death family protein